MRVRFWSIVVAALLAPTVGTAQTMGIMESAEIIQRGNFKFTGYPMLVLDDNGVDDDWGVVLRGGYGFTDRLDAELAVALLDGATLIGGNVELALMRALQARGGVDLSARGGLHLVDGDGPDAVGLDLAGILSTRLTPNLELVGSLDFNRNFYDEPVEDRNTFHLVPGFEYGLSRDLDVLAEFGLGLNEGAANYLSAGLALYFR